MNTNFWKSKKVLVSGAGGFIGSHLVEALVARGAQVRAFVRYNSRGDVGLLRMIPETMRAGIEIIGGDLRDPHAIQDAVKGCQVVFHLGALISIPYSYVHPYEVAQTNVMGTLNMLEACRSNEVEKLVHTSTSEVYGSALRVPIDEDHPLQGQSPYSASKIGADKLAESFYRSFSLPVVTIRPFNTFGPRQSARAVIPVIITQALRGGKIQLGNTETTRDFTYVDDTVRGFILAAETEGVEGEVMNLGSGRELRIAKLCELIVSKIGLPVEIVVDKMRLRPEKSEVQRLLSDNHLAREKIAWQPQVSLEEGLDHTIAWIREHLDMYRVGKYEF
jgi:NAD dependent epimerase/dehydratase